MKFKKSHPDFPGTSSNQREGIINVFGECFWCQLVRDAQSYKYRRLIAINHHEIVSHQATLRSSDCILSGFKPGLRQRPLFRLKTTSPLDALLAPFAADAPI